MSDHLDNYNFEEIEKSINRIKNNGSNSNLIQEIETNIINKEKMKQSHLIIIII